LPVELVSTIRAMTWKLHVFSVSQCIRHLCKLHRVHFSIWVILAGGNKWKRWPQ